MVKSMKNNVTIEQNEVLVKIKDFSKYSYPKEPKEPPLESFGLKEEVFLKLKKILFYNDYYGRYDFFFGFGHQTFIDEGCDVTNCFTTSNKSLLCKCHC